MTRSSLLRRIIPALLTAGLLLAPLPGNAQLRLDTPDTVFPEDFGAIQTVRELPDGRVLVADPLSRALYAVDLQAGTRALIGREGEGPREYRQPDAVWPWPGDSTLLVDLGNGRLVVLGRELSFGPTTPIMVGDFQPGSPPLLALPQGVDGQGRVYARAMIGGGGGGIPDSSAILRIDPFTGQSERMATFKTPDMRQATSGGADDQQVRITAIPLSPEDAWGVAPDGSVIIARSADYHLERIAPDGSLVRGPAIPYDPVRIGTPEKEEYLAEQGRSGGGINIGVEVVNGAATMSFARGGGQSTAQEIARYTWPERKAAFYGGRIPIDLRGRAWVRRHGRAGEATRYDVFDTSVNRVGTVEMPHGKRIVGFGTNSVYVVAFDEFDLNYLERYPLPAF